MNNIGPQQKMRNAISAIQENQFVFIRIPFMLTAGVGLPKATRTWQEHWHVTPVFAVLVPKFFYHLPLLFSRQEDVGDGDDGKRGQRKDPRPGDHHFAKAAPKNP